MNEILVQNCGSPTECIGDTAQVVRAIDYGRVGCSVHWRRRDGLATREWQKVRHSGYRPVIGGTENAGLENTGTW